MNRKLVDSGGIPKSQSLSTLLFQIIDPCALSSLPLRSFILANIRTFLLNLTGRKLKLPKDLSFD